MQNEYLETITYNSPDIDSDQDRDNLETRLGGIDGVRDVEVDPNAHTVQITYDPTVVNEDRFRAAIEDAGFKLGSGEDRGEAAAYLGSEMNRTDQSSDTGRQSGGLFGGQETGPAG